MAAPEKTDWSQFSPVNPAPSTGGTDWSQFTPVGKQGDSSNFVRGVKVALGQLAPLAEGAVGLLGATAEKAVGEGGIATAVKDWGLKGYAEGMQKLQPIKEDNDELTTAWKRAMGGDAHALLDWAAYGLGYAAGQIGTAAVTSAIGGVVGTAVAGPGGGAAGAVEGAIAPGAVKAAAQKVLAPLIEKELAKITAAQAARVEAGEAAAQLTTQQATRLAVANVAKSVGQVGGLGAYAGVQEAGSIYPDAEKESLEKTGKSLDGADLARVWAGTAIATLLEGATEKMHLDALTGKITVPGGGGRVARAATGAAIGAAGEAGTEFAQTVAERWGSGQSLTDDEAVKDYINSAGLGAVGGGGTGIISGALHAPQKAGAPAPADRIGDLSAAVDEYLGGGAQPQQAPLALPAPVQKVNNWEVVGGTGIDGNGTGPAGGVLPAPATPAALALPAPVQKVNNWEVVDGVKSLPAPDAAAHVLATGSVDEAIKAAQEVSGSLAGHLAEQRESFATHLLDSPAVSPTIMVDSQGNAAVQPDVARVEALNRDFANQQAAAQEAENRASLGLTPDQALASPPGAPAVPRPAKINGAETSSLTDAQLHSLAEDQSLSPVSRRSARIELMARQTEAAQKSSDETARVRANDQAMSAQEQQAQAAQAARNAQAAAASQPKTSGAPNVDSVIAALRVEPALRTAEQKVAVDAAGKSFTSEQMGILDKASKGPFALNGTEKIALRQMRGEVQNSGKRSVQEALDAAGENDKRTVVDPASLPHHKQAAAGELSRQGYGVIKQLARVFGKKLVIFDSTDPRAADGFTYRNDSSTIYLNRRAEKPHLVVFGHELMHNLARDNPAAYQAIRRAIKLKDGTDLNKLPGIRGDQEELVSDLQGNRFAEVGFWNEVFKDILKTQGTAEGKKTVTKLGVTAMRAINSLMKALGRPGGFDADKYVTNLEEVKTAIKSALAGYAKDQYQTAVELDSAERVQKTAKSEHVEESAASDNGQESATADSAKRFTIKEVPGGFDAHDENGERIGHLRDNLERGQAKQLDEKASVDIVKVRPDYKGKGVGSALYDAFNDKHEGLIQPSGKTSLEAWALWKRKFPEKVQQFVEQEASRISDGADPKLVLRNITDPEVAARVTREAEATGAMYSKKRDDNEPVTIILSGRKIDIKDPAKAMSILRQKIEKYGELVKCLA